MLSLFWPTNAQICLFNVIFELKECMISLYLKWLMTAMMRKKVAKQAAVIAPRIPLFWGGKVSFRNTSSSLWRDNVWWLVASIWMSMFKNVTSWWDGILLLEYTYCVVLVVWNRIGIIHPWRMVILTKADERQTQRSSLRGRAPLWLHTQAILSQSAIFTAVQTISTSQRNNYHMKEQTYVPQRPCNYDLK